MAELLVPYGLNDAGRLMHVDDVPRGDSCGLHCPSCKSPLRANKGSIKQHWLSHQAGNPACEGWLHAAVKRLLHQRIADAIADSNPLTIQWRCTDQHCGLHKANLLGKGILTNVQLERRLPEWNIQPDITCMAGDAPKVLVEVVDTHSPEPQVIAAGLPVLEVKVTDTADLDKLAIGVVSVSKVHNRPCPDPICLQCGRRASKGCWYCPLCGQHDSPCSHGAYCQQCGSCSNDAHRHCRDCGQRFYAWKGYSRCYCCNLARQLGRVPCYRRGLTIDSHRHCKQCKGEMDSDKQHLYEICYRCYRYNQQERQEAQERQLRAQEAAEERKQRDLEERYRHATAEDLRRSWLGGQIPYVQYEASLKRE